MRQNLFVGPNKPYKTIQSAIDAASDYDQIDIVPGLYEENIVIRKNGLKLQPDERGKKSNDDDVIIMAVTGPAILVDIKPDELCQIQGIKITAIGEESDDWSESSQSNKKKSAKQKKPKTKKKKHKKRS